MSNQPSQKPEETSLSPDVDVDLIDYRLSLTPIERIIRHGRALEAVRALREAGKRLYGFDPRSPDTDE